ncbi:MAG TPA: trypsin-like peptidase domain-containing protein, partial [Ktedonobacteraceae bacterium]|nr:trypsin-like peptidase domain-containing protein [Ktedonobacteraceae bacterium]
MLQKQTQDSVTRTDVPAEQSTPVVIHLMRTRALVMLSVLLLVVLGVGLFAGWVYGTRSTGGVSSGTNSTVSRPPTALTGNAFDALREAAVAKARPTVVQINVVTSSGNGLGSGVILDSRGYIVTNNHVIADAQSIQVILYDGASLSAQLVGVDLLDD